MFSFFWSGRGRQRDFLPWQRSLRWSVCSRRAIEGMAAKDPVRCRSVGSLFGGMKIFVFVLLWFRSTLKFSQQKKPTLEMWEVIFWHIFCVDVHSYLVNPTQNLTFFRVICWQSKLPQEKWRNFLDDSLDWRSEILLNLQECWTELRWGLKDKVLMQYLDSTPSR